MKRKQVAIVEDDYDLREVIALILENELYTIKLLPNAFMFNRYIKEHTPDLILLDVMLPDGNGIKICQELKSNPRTQQIPVLLMSANTELKPGDGGASDAIKKPFDIAELRQKVAQYL